MLGGLFVNPMHFLSLAYIDLRAWLQFSLSFQFIPHILVVKMPNKGISKEKYSKFKKAVVKI